MDWDYLWKAIFRQSTMMLDNVGIRINTRELPSWEAYHQARQRFFGTGWLGRLWCQHIRLGLFPNRHQRIEQEYRQRWLLYQQEFMNAVIDKAKELDA